MSEHRASGNGVATAVGVLMVVEGVVFVLAALLHAGVQLPLGIDEPRIIAAMIVEGVIGIAFFVAAWAVFANRPAAWKGAVAAHAVAVAGVLLGMVALGLGQGPRTPANDVYHRVMIVLAALLVVFLRTRAGRAAFSADRV